MSLDPSASAGGTPPKQNAPPLKQANADDEDLFNFDAASQGTVETAAAIAADLDIALANVEEAQAQLAPEIKPQPAPVATNATVTRRFRRPPQEELEPLTVTPAPPAIAAVVQPTSILSPLAATLLGLVVVANVGLVWFAWSSMTSVKDLVVDMGHQVLDTTTQLRAESSRRNEVLADETTPTFGVQPEGFRTLQLARERIERGEFERARRALYGVLAVIDGIEPPARGELEAQANFLIAESHRLQADAVGGAR